MKNQKLTLEYGLHTRSNNLLWDTISTIDGLSNWIADSVIQKDDLITFSWGEPWTHQETRSARIIKIEKYHSIRLKWDDDEDDNEDIYWEMRIEQSKETDDYVLIITDFGDSDDIDGLKDIWDDNMKRLHQFSGI